MRDHPTGTVTFLFTDIEGSTRLLAELGDEYGRLLEEQRRIIGQAVEAHGGQTFGTEGDAVFAVFERATGALSAAAEFQRALLARDWPDGREVRVRVGIHSGEVTLSDGGYVGMAIHEVARISAAGHGGQILVSSAARELALDGQPPGVQLRDLGEHRLKDLSHPARLYQLVGDGLQDTFPPLRTLGRRPNNLPVQLSSFVGRAELAEIHRLLDGSRLLTLTGPGGTGKTRLALQLATGTSDGFDDGVFFVPLDALLDPDLVPAAIVAALGLAAAPSNAGPPLQRVIDYLRDRNVLLVLDNFEQLVEGSSIVAEILREAPSLKVIATSRVPLRISGEQEFRVPSLGLPGREPATAREALESEAVRLFVERATASRPDFRLDDENAPVVADIVRRLDGLPLAIELAAARVGVLPVEALRDRLDRRLAVLTHGARDLPARQQTLRGAIEWSYDLLERADRELFERFGVFAGAACLIEAEPVCGPPDELGEDVLDGLVSLGEKSLLVSMPVAVEPPRFGMLATIREYAGERMAERDHAEALRRRHAETYLALVEQIAPNLQGARTRELLERLEQDHDNLRLAFDWAIERGDAELSLRFLTGVWRFWQIRGHLEEGWERAQRVLRLPGVADQPSGLRARALGAVGSIAYWRNDGQAAHDFYRQALELARASDDRAALAQALLNFGFAPEPLEAIGVMPIRGEPFLQQAAALYRELGDIDGLAHATWALGGVYSDAGDIERGRELHLESLELYRQTDNRFGMGWSLFTMAQLDFRAGQMGDAFQRIIEALKVFHSSSDVTGITMCLFGLSMGARVLGLGEAQWRLAAASDALIRRLGLRLDPALLGQLGLDVVRRPTDDPEAERAWNAGAEMSVDDAVRYAFDVAADLAGVAPEPAPPAD